MKTRVVAAAIIEKNGQLLMGKKPKDIGPYPNCWLLLGGGIDLQEESLEEAIRREVREEANIEITDVEPVFFQEDYEGDYKNRMTHFLFLIYKAKYKSGQEKPGDDIVELAWFDKKELPMLDLARPSIKLFKYMGWL